MILFLMVLAVHLYLLVGMVFAYVGRRLTMCGFLVTDTNEAAFLVFLWPLFIVICLFILATWPIRQVYKKVTKGLPW